MFATNLIEALQSFSMPWLDTFFITITQLGHHYAYMLIIPFIYWALDRQIGCRLAGVFFLSMWLNGLVKEFWVSPRPDPESVRVLAFEPSPGFPSGHAQGALTLWGYLSMAYRKRWLIVFSVIIVLLLSISRLYLGVHFPGDIVGGLFLAGLVLVLYAWFIGTPRRPRLGLRLRLLFTLLIPLALYPLYQTSTSEQIIGFFIGFFTAEMTMGHLIPFQEKMRVPQQIAKLLIGYAGFFVLIALHMVFVPVGLPSIFGYSIIALWVCLGAPLCFHFFGIAGNKSIQYRVDALTEHHVRHYLATAAVVFVFVISSTFYVLLLVPQPTLPAFLQSRDPLVLAHAGAAGLAPANTMTAFEHAVLHDVDVLEMDVSLTADNEVVVIHDLTVDRTTDGTGRVDRMTLEQIQALDAGYNFTTDGGTTYPWRGQGVRIPTLEEVLSTFSHVGFVVELKGSNPQLADEVAKVIRRTGTNEKVLVVSFDDQLIQRMRTVMPDVATSYSLKETARRVILQRLGLGAFFAPTAVAFQVPEHYNVLRVITPGLLRLARQQGVQVHVWTVNEAETMRRLVAMGVHGIITDYPDRLHRVLREAPQRAKANTLY